MTSIQLISPIEVATLSFGVLLACFFAHEIGHMFMAKRLGKDSDLHVRTYNVELNFDVLGLTPEEIKSVYWAGILSGVYPLFIFFLLPVPGALSFFLFIGGLLLHLSTTTYDIKQLRRLKGDNVKAIFLFMSPLAMFLSLCVVALIGWLVL